jgi:hypothetical protein
VLRSVLHCDVRSESTVMICAIVITLIGSDEGIVNFAMRKSESCAAHRFVASQHAAAYRLVIGIKTDLGGLIHQPV